MHSLERKACLVFPFVIHLFTLTQHISGNELQDYSDKVANAFKEKLFKYTEKVTQYHKIQEEFTNSTEELIFNKANGKELNDMFVNKLQKLFDRKYKVLEKIKDRANKSKVNHKNDPKIPKFNYHNIRDIRDGKGNATVEIDESFSSTVPINRNFSFVQVPTNIYSESNTVLNTADWTKELDEVFKENSEDPQNEDLLYQYYGDSSGKIILLLRLISKSQNKKLKFLWNLFRQIPFHTNASFSLENVRKQEVSLCFEGV